MLLDRKKLDKPRQSESPLQSVFVDWLQDRCFAGLRSWTEDLQQIPRASGLKSIIAHQGIPTVPSSRPCEEEVADHVAHTHTPAIQPHQSIWPVLFFDHRVHAQVSRVELLNQLRQDVLAPATKEVDAAAISDQLEHPMVAWTNPMLATLVRWLANRIILKSVPAQPG